VTPEQARELFSAAYDGQLEPAERAQFDAALSGNAELTSQYLAFCDTLSVLQADRSEATDTPDLLRGVQTRLRLKSGGRYYSDRFAERSGWGLRGPVALLCAVLLLLAIAWLGFEVLRGVELLR
jgi:hypothetical protein